MKMWTERCEFIFRDGINLSKQDMKAKREADENACFQRFMSGPEDEGEYDSVEWEKATRRTVPVLNKRGSVVGEAVVYAAPMGVLP